MTAREDRRARFAAAHTSGELLFVANAWDVGSALVLERAGAEAIGTSSAAAAWTAGFADGERLPAGELVDHVVRIARAVALPVTVDMERGYSDEPDEVATLAEALVEAGAVGVNIEDRGAAPETLAAKIAAVRSRLEGALYVSARADVVLHARAPADIEEVVRRGLVYAAAGADALFVPGLRDLESLRTVARSVPLALHVMTVPGLPSRAELVGAGVRRVSAGPCFYQVALGAAAGALRDVRERGDWAALSDRAPSYGTMNALVSR